MNMIPPPRQRTCSLSIGIWLLACSSSVGFTQVPDSQPPASAKPALSCTEMEEFLLNAKVVSKKALSTGVTNSERAVLDDGKIRHDAHIQTVDIRKTSFQTNQGIEINFRDFYKFNMAAYELNKLLELAMVPVSVERKVGSMAAVTWWVEDTLMTELERKKKKIEPPDQRSWNQQLYVCRVFDQLIYNTDRNVGNVIITKDWKIWMIDHTRAFRTMKDLRSPQDLVQYDRSLLAKLKELNKETLKQKLGPYLTSTEIEGLLARRDKIVKFFDDQITKKGEANVLYDLAGNQQWDNPLSIFPAAKSLEVCTYRSLDRQGLPSPDGWS